MHSAVMGHDQAARLRQLARRSQGGDSLRPFVVTVAGAKGGVGKSVIALNLALACSRIGQRVLLIDSDTQLGSIEVLLGIAPAVTLPEVLAGLRGIEEAITRPFRHLAVLSGRAHGSPIPSLDAVRRREYCEELQQYGFAFDVVVTDTPAGMAEHTIDLAVGSDRILIVTTPEPSAIIDSYAMMKLIYQKSDSTDIGIIVNNVRTPAHAEEAYEKLRIALKHFLALDVEFEGFIPHDEEVPRSVEQQKPVVQYCSTAPAAFALQTLAERLVKKLYQFKRSAEGVVI